MNIRTARFGALGAIVAVVALLAIHPWSRGDGLPADAAFRYGSRVVTVAELDHRTTVLTALYGVQKPAVGDALDAFNRQAAKSMAINLVLDRAVADHDISVPDAEVDKAIKALIASQFGGSSQQFAADLAKVGVDEATVRDEVARQLELRRLLGQVAGDVEVTDTEARAAFPDHRSELGTPERRTVFNVVVATRAAGSQARKALDEGAPVQAVARQVSIDGATRDRGGRLGLVTESQLLPEVGSAAFAAPAGGAYGPVRGAQGWNVGVVARVVPAVPATLADSLPALRAIVANEYKQTAWSAWLREKLGEAGIEYASAYRPEDPLDVSAWQDPSADGSGAGR